MNKNLVIYFTALCLTILTTDAAAETSLFGGGGSKQEIVVNNRVLAIANGNPITVIDLMKKMDMLFYRQFPQFTSSSQARFQFYQAHWKQVLAEAIDKELIVADAEESKMQISAGDVRQEMEALFGPNIITNLDKVGLTFDEAYKMVLADITIRRMMYFRVHLKAISRATPLKIREVYEEVAKKNIRDNVWVYNVVTVRHKDATKAADLAHIAHTLLTDDGVALDKLLTTIDQHSAPSPKRPSISLSEEFRTNEKELSEAYKKTLEKMHAGAYSLPIAQKSRSDGSTAVRIFYLKEITPGGPVSFAEVEGIVKEKIIEEGVEQESKAYLARLRQHYDIQEGHLELLSADFQPFVLQ